MFLKSALIMLFLCANNFVLAQAQSVDNKAKSIKIWKQNQNLPATFEFIQLALNKAEDKYGKISIVTMDANDANTAIQMLSQPNQLDVLVSAVNKEWEQQANVIYIPLDRGLLGFRVCLVNKADQGSLMGLATVGEFANKGVSILVQDSWPDKDIHQANGFDVQGFETLNELSERMLAGSNKCFTRSLIEIKDDAAYYPSLSIEEHVGFIYPLADIIYVSKHNKFIHEVLTYGLEKAIEDKSYFALFEQHYANTLEQQSFYFRKMFLMKNKSISSEAIQAINKYGVVSFNDSLASNE